MLNDTNQLPNPGHLLLERTPRHALLILKKATFLLLRLCLDDEKEICIIMPRAYVVLGRTGSRAGTVPDLF